MADRGPGGRFLRKREREAAASTQLSTDSNTTTNTEANSQEGTTNMSATDTVEGGIEFVDELPKINRKVESGVWVKRLAPLRDNPDRWAKVYGPTPSPHAQINNLRGGSAAGIDPEEFDFAGRMIPTGETDDEGNEVKEGYVFARFVSDEDERAELKARREERGAKARASREANASDDE